MMFTSASLSWLDMSLVSVLPLITPVTGNVKYIEMDVNVVPDWNVSVYLEWVEPSPPDPGVGDISYMVYCSTSELGPFTQLTQQPITDTRFFTYHQIQDSKIYEQYFTIECLYTDGRIYRSIPQSPAVALSRWHQLRHKDIIRREAILLDKFAGVDVTVYTRKWSGLRCRECWDPVNLKINKDHCESCYGIGFEGGYDTGMNTKMQFTSIDQQSAFTYNGVNEPTTISAWALPFPLIHVHAILLRRSDRKLFKVIGHQGSTEMLTNMQRQNFVIKELSRDSVENKLFNRTDTINVMPRKPHVHH